MFGPFFDQYLQSTVAILGTALLLGLRAAVKNSDYRRDLRGAAFYLIASVAVRVAHVFVREVFWTSPNVDAYLDAGRSLLFAFGIIRTLVGSGVWLFRGRRGVHTPKILRDVIDGVLYMVATAVIVRTSLNVDLTSLVATSAALSVVVGLALQETLGNLFAGLSLQVEHPFQVGDWVTVNEFTGRVVQVAWRATKLETMRREQVSIPNGTIAKANVVNFSRHGMVARDLTLGIAYACPPNQVKAVLHDVLVSLPEVLSMPPPKVRTLRFDDSAVTYEIRFFVKHYDQLEHTSDSILSALWYRLKREGMDIPFPQRVVEMRQVPVLDPAQLAAPALADTVSLLEAVDFLKPLGPDGRAQLAPLMKLEHYGNQETIIRAGDAGDSFYLVARGEVAVKAKVGDKEQQVATLKRGQFFGEMSLLTGEPRSATVVAQGDASLVSMSRVAFGEVLSKHSSVAQELADILGRRRAELDKAKADDTTNLSRAESKRIFSRLRELFKVAED
jgi:small-conductance mechanosensitive channel/CRP-like cAMP-binding protein